MLYFIPAWYKKNKWVENEQRWYIRREKSEFDETIKQITLFHRNVKLPYQILLLSFSPNLRHFLHRQGMYRASYWSCFDAIQQIHRSKIAILSYKDIMWPQGVEFVYSPFAIVAFLRGQKYATINFGDDGNPISIVMYENNEICRKNYYDDRGFIGATAIYQDGEEIYRDILMENGTWKMRLFQQDGHVEINPATPVYDVSNQGETQTRTFKNLYYDAMDDVIREVLDAYLMTSQPDDKFFVAAHPLHMAVVQETLHHREVILTFFEQRYPMDQLHKIESFIYSAGYIIADSVQTENAICKNLAQVPPRMMNISPYDTRIDFGISAQLKVQNILLPIDGIAQNEFVQILVEVASYLQKNNLARLHLFSRNGSWGYEDKIKAEVLQILTKAGYEETWILGGMDQNEETCTQRIYVDICVDERTISKCINEQRVILDLRQKTDVYVFITAISKGVPRISMSEDEYLIHGGNGYLIADDTQIQPALSYYLDNFENWNAALVACYDIGQKYTTNVLLESWRKVLGISE